MWQHMFSMPVMCTVWRRELYIYVTHTTGMPQLKIWNDVSNYTQLYSHFRHPVVAWLTYDSLLLNLHCSYRTYWQVDGLEFVTALSARRDTEGTSVYVIRWAANCSRTTWNGDGNRDQLSGPSYGDSYSSGRTNPGRLNFVLWRQIFLDPQ